MINCAWFCNFYTVCTYTHRSTSYLPWVAAALSGKVPSSNSGNFRQKRKRICEEIKTLVTTLENINELRNKTTDSCWNICYLFRGQQTFQNELINQTPRCDSKLYNMPKGCGCSKNGTLIAGYNIWAKKAGSYSINSWIYRQKKYEHMPINILYSDSDLCSYF